MLRSASLLRHYYVACLCVPLIDRGILQGVLVVQTIEPRVFSTEDIRMLAEAATQVAPVVSEARTLDGLARCRRARWKHGRYSAEEIAERKRAHDLIRQSRELLEKL